MHTPVAGWARIAGARSMPRTGLQTCLAIGMNNALRLLISVPLKSCRIASSWGSGTYLCSCKQALYGSWLPASAISIPAIQPSLLIILDLCRLKPQT